MTLDPWLGDGLIDVSGALRRELQLTAWLTCLYPGERVAYMTGRK